MSIINQRGSDRIVLPRVNGDAFWETVREHYAQEDPRCWKFLAMFALHTTAGMSVEKIGHAFGHPPGHVSRCLQIVKRELRSRFQPPSHNSPVDENDALTEDSHAALQDVVV